MQRLDLNHSGIGNWKTEGIWVIRISIWMLPTSVATTVVTAGQ